MAKLLRVVVVASVRPRLLGDLRQPVALVLQDGERHTVVGVSSEPSADSYALLA